MAFFAVFLMVLDHSAMGEHWEARFCVIKQMTILVKWSLTFFHENMIYVQKKCMHLMMYRIWQLSRWFWDWLNNIKCLEMY